MTDTLTYYLRAVQNSELTLAEVPIEYRKDVLRLIYMETEAELFLTRIAHSMKFLPRAGFGFLQENNLFNA